jgi:hypothetical protein
MSAKLLVPIKVKIALKKINSSLYSSATSGHVLLDVQFRNLQNEDASAIGGQVAKKTGFNLKRYKFDQSKVSGVWTFDLGKDEGMDTISSFHNRILEEIKVYGRKALEERDVYILGDSSVYAPTLSKPRLKKLRGFITQYLERGKSVDYVVRGFEGFK